MMGQLVTVYNVVINVFLVLLLIQIAFYVKEFREILILLHVHVQMNILMMEPIWTA